MQHYFPGSSILLWNKPLHLQKLVTGIMQWLIPLIQWTCILSSRGSFNELPSKFCTLANIFLCHLAEKWLRDCPMEYKSIYSTDMWMLHMPCLNYSITLAFFSIIWTINIQTLTYPSTSPSRYFDIKCSQISNIHHSQEHIHGTISTNFLSICYHKFKINAIRSLVHRAYYLSSHYDPLHAELSFLKYFYITMDNPITFYEECTKFFGTIY